jgi:hypothetical protein
MTLLARVTEPLSRFDASLNAVNDASARLVPLGWWPIGPPRPEDPYGAREHAVYLGWSVVGFGIGESLNATRPADQRSTGALLLGERALTLVLGVLWWAAFAGAWDRRAERLRRRPWRRWRPR